MTGVETGDFGALSVILAMAAVSHLLRVGGFGLMGRVPLTPRVRRMFDVLPGSVVAATVVPIVASAGLPAALAVGAVAGLMIVRPNEFLAVSGGVAVAVLARASGLLRRDRPSQNRHARLDPGIHHSSHKSSLTDGLPGQARQWRLGAA